MKKIIYTCPYVPAEWIAIHGMHPSRIMPDTLEPTATFARIEGVCPYVRAFINEVITNTLASAVVLTTVCDQMRRAFDIITRRCRLPAFLMNVPTTWQNSATCKLYQDELKRLGRFLIHLGGKPQSTDALAKIMLDYDTARMSILAAREYLTSRRYSEAIAEFNQDGKVAFTSDMTDKKPPTNSIPLAIIGGPLLKQDFQLFDIVENSGGRIALDATETGERGLCATFDRRALQNDPLIELSQAYFAGIPDASRRPNNQLYSWLKYKLVSRKVRGIIFRRYIWCDIWHAELGRMKQWSALPILDIDAGGNRQTLPTQTTQRIYAFLEMLQ